MKGIVVAVGMAALLAPAIASANTGVGLLALSVPASIAALIPAILIEGPVLARFLKVPWRRGLWLSAIANIASTVLGGLIAIASSLVIPFWTDMSREAVLISLLPMFFITWWLENLVVRRMQPPDKKPLAFRATGVANAITYAAMAIGVSILVPPASALFSRYKLSEPLAELGAVRVEVAEHFEKHKAFPAPKPFAPVTRNVRSIALESGGRLVMVLSYPASPVADGKQIVYEPRVADGRIVEWRCYSPDLAAKYLPAACR